MRRLKWVTGIVWVLTWAALYLEIFLWHHVTRSLHLNPPPPPPGTNIKPQPGGFLIAVLTGSAVAPLAFMAVVIVGWARKRRVHLAV
jgi:hypothetical protein